MSYREALKKIKKSKRNGVSELDLSGMDLVSIPKELSELKLLTKLDLSYNEIHEVSNLGQLMLLGDLDLSNNKISKISGLEELFLLTNLNLSSNDISEIKDLEQLTQLKELNLAKNKISRIENLEQLTQLKNLDLSRNKIYEIAGLNKLTSLVELHLSENKISKIEGLDHLRSLQALYLDMNKISEIKGLDQLLDLQALGLSGNKISEIKGLDQLTELTGLGLGSNEIKEVKNLDHLRLLNSLILGGNQISEIKGLDQLVLLTKLWLNDNLIRDINYLNQLTSLTRLLLHNNRIETIPKDLLNLDMNILWTTDIVDEGLSIGGNPLVQPPSEIAEEGNEAIRRYWEQIVKEGEDYLYEAKLILVGDGGAGKTTLLHRLQGKNTGTERTRGVEIGIHTYTNRDGKDIRLNVWDFGGQDIYYAVHRFFLTENALYLLLSQTRSSKDNFDYWIPNIALFGGQSPIMVIKNLYESFQRDISIKRFVQSNFFNVVNQVFGADLLNGKIKKIKEAIYYHTESLPHIGQPVPVNWIRVRDRLAAIAEKTSYISFEQFESLCVEEQIRNTEVIKDLAKYFNNLGIVLWYHWIPQLKGKVILQPGWITNAVYRVVDDELIQKRKGHFLVTDLQRLWVEDSYKEMQDELVELMKAFKLCYQKKGSKKYIIPALLIEDEPREPWEEGGYLEVQYEYLFMPKGVVNQLTAQLNRYIQTDEDVWSRGVILNDALAEARVVENFFERTIEIQVRGIQAAGFLQVIMKDLDEINESYAGIKYEKLVPCICSHCNQSATPQKIKYDQLINLLKKERGQFFCNEGGEEVSIEQLLLNIGIQVKRDEGTKRIISGDVREEQKKEARPLNIFFSYSKKDKELRDELDEFLAPLKRSKDVETWHDRDILPGEEWDQSIRDQLERADIILFLVSSTFLNTEYIMDIEVPRAMERYHNKTAAVVPIILRPCMWEETEFSKLQAVPTKGKPITDWDDKESAYYNAASEIRRLIKELKKGFPR